MQINIERFKRRIQTRRYRIWLGSRILVVGAVVAAVTVPLCVHAESGNSGAQEPETIVVYTHTPEAEITPAPEKTPEAIVVPTPSPEQFTAYIYDVPMEDKLQLFVARLCEEHHIDTAIVLGMAQRETNFDAEAIGDGGDSFGMWQVQPKWHQERMDKLGVSDLLDPYQNAAVAVDYLAEMLGWYDGDIAKALTAYNQGSYRGVVSDYAKAVIENSENIKKGMKQVFYSDDPLADFEAWDKHQNEQLEKLPKCAQCGHHIQDDRLLNIHGDLFHISCADDAFGEWTEEYTE